MCTDLDHGSLQRNTGQRAHTRHRATQRQSPHEVGQTKRVGVIPNVLLHRLQSRLLNCFTTAPSASTRRDVLTAFLSKDTPHAVSHGASSFFFLFTLPHKSKEGVSTPVCSCCQSCETCFTLPTKKCNKLSLFLPLGVSYISRQRAYNFCQHNIYAC